MKDRKDSIKGVLLVAVSAISFAWLPIFVKIAYTTGASSYTLLFIRFVIGSAFMFALVFAGKKKLPEKKNIIILMLLGAIGYVGQSFSFFTALNYTTAGTVDLLLYLYPALVTIGSAVFLKEKITVRKVVSLCIALAGAFIIIGSQFQASVLGIAFSLAAAVIYSGYILLTSVFVKDGYELQSSAFIMLGAAITYGIMNIFAGFTPPSGIKGYAVAVGIALISTALAFWSFFAGMSKIGPSMTSLVSVLEPVVTVIVSAFVLSERITANIVIGGSCVVAALIISVAGRPPEGEQPVQETAGEELAAGRPQERS